jgi:hypothetical protein
LTLPKVLAVAVALILAGGGAATQTLRHAGADSRALAAGASTASPAAAERVLAQAPERLGHTSPTATRTAVLPGLEQPASGVPVSAGADPVSPAAAPIAPAVPVTPSVTLPVPASGSLPAVPALQGTRSPDAVVLSSSTLTPSELGHVSHIPGVAALDAVDTGTVTMGGSPVVTFGVDPGAFRAFTPAASASSDQLWQYLAAGSLISSYDMAHDRGLQLGANQLVVPAGGTGAVQGWLGAFASIGLPGVDLLVDRSYSSDLGLTPDSGLVLAAPNVPGPTLQSELQSALPGSAVELLHPDQVIQPLSGGSLSGSTRQRIVQAALSRVGLPYIWGASGPTSFDCSGLVQWSYRQAGILMPRVAAEQFLTGAHVPLSAAQPGDLLFWTYDPTDPGYIDHTAIYLGNGMMVEAPHTGLDVQVVPVPTQDFAGAVSVVLRSS